MRRWALAALATVPLAALLAGCSAVPAPAAVAPTSRAPSAEASAPVPGGAAQTAALARVRAGGFPSSAQVRLVSEPTAWLARKSEGVFFVVRVTEPDQEADFYFEKASGRLDAIAVKTPSQEARVFDRLTVPAGADLSRIVSQLRGAGGQP